MDKLEAALVVVDPAAERDFAVDRAMLIARKTGAALRFLVNSANTLSERSFLYEGVDQEFFQTQKRLFREHHRRRLERLVDECAGEGIKASSEFSERHHPAEAVIDRVRELRPDLVLKSVRRRGADRRPLVAGTDWRLIRKCPAPLWLVKPGAWREGGSVVAAVDPLHNKAAQWRLDQKLARAAGAAARLLSLSPRVFHSYYPFVSNLFPAGGGTREYLDRIRREHQAKVEALTAECGMADAAVELSEGEPAPALARHLKEADARLVVVGALSRNIVERAVVGNTAEKILEDCPCDVLVLKP